jgi:hypothetical protein
LLQQPSCHCGFGGFGGCSVAANRQILPIFSRTRIFVPGSAEHIAVS